MVPGPGSIFRGIGKLQAAEVVRIDGSGIHRQRHWEPDFNRPRKVSDYQRNCGELRERLRAGVRRCMAADMNTGSFLSGGLDSSTVTGFLAEATGGKAPAFAIGFDAPGYDEMAYARTTARHFGVTLHEYYVTPDDVVEALPLIAGSFEEPFGNSSALPAYFCARVARNHGIDCLLAGDGGDELFAGNERYARQKVFSVYHQLPSVLRNQLLEPVLRALPASTPLAGKARSYVDQATTPLPDRLQSYNFLHRHDPGELFGSDVLSRIDTNQPLELLRAIYRRPANATELDRMLYLDWQITLADNDLRKVSHTCALAGIGVRFPMLDDDLLEFSCTLPDDWKLPRQKLRQFYKNALADWLPQETLRKKKQGFGLPFGVWMQEYAPLRELAYDTLLQLKRRPLFRPEFIDNTIELHRSRHAAYYGELVWILTVLELWMQSHGVDF
nr:asparagine synthase C-terminal domain-containing protein [Parahaliea mediterranea]